MMPRLLGAALFAGAMIAMPISASLADDGDDDTPQYQVKDGMVNKAPIRASAAIIVNVTAVTARTAWVILAPNC